MQDGASIHKAGTIKQWFSDMGIPVTDWPAISPDLNPIEHIWLHLQKRVLEAFPELQDMGASEEDIHALGKTLAQAWDDLPDGLFSSLLNSMPRTDGSLYQDRGMAYKILEGLCFWSVNGVLFFFNL